MNMMDRAFGVQMPFQDMTSPYYVLIEIFEREDDSVDGEERLYEFLDKVGDLIEDGVVPHDEK